MKKTGKIGSILCLLALLGLTGIYALPKVYVLYQANTGKVDICLKEYMLEEGKEVPWKNGKDVLPGGFVSKIPRIRNDGVECYVRATVSFSSQKESEKPLSLENLEGISSDWVRDGDYFYYKHTVKPEKRWSSFRESESHGNGKHRMKIMCGKPVSVQRQYRQNIFHRILPGKIRGG